MDPTQKVCSSCNSTRSSEFISVCNQCNNDRCDVCTWTFCYVDKKICGKCFDKDHTRICKYCETSFVDWKLYEDNICYPCKNPKRPLKILNDQRWCLNHSLWQKLGAEFKENKLVFADGFKIQSAGTQIYIYNEDKKIVAFMQHVDKSYDKDFRLEILDETISTDWRDIQKFRLPIKEAKKSDQQVQQIESKESFFTKFIHHLWDLFTFI